MVTWEERKKERNCTSMLTWSDGYFTLRLSPPALCKKGEAVDDPEEQLSDTECKGATENASVQRSGPEASQETGREEEDEDETASFEDCTSEADWQTCSEGSGDEEEKAKCAASFYNSSRLLRKDELLEMFQSAHSGPRCKADQLTVGLVRSNSWVNLYTHSFYSVRESDTILSLV